MNQGARNRLIEGMISAANSEGYPGVSIATVASRAKVSKPTFYRHFRRRDECFIAALACIQEQLLAYVRATIDSDQPRDATTSGIKALISFAAREPREAEFLISEVLGAGPAALDARDKSIAEIASAIEARLAASSPRDPSPDVPIDIIVGGVQRVLASRLRRREQLSEQFANELLAWIKSYEVPGEAHRWGVMRPSITFGPPPYLANKVPRTPQVISPGRPRISGAEVEANQRLRILYAASRLAYEKGYRATTVAAIAKLAHVDLGVVYKHFSSKEEIFLASDKWGMEEMMTVSAAAHFAGNTWSERCWEGGRAFLQFLDTHPRIIPLAVVESYAIGREAAQRVEDIYLPFVVFLRDGLSYCTPQNPPGDTAFEAIVATYFEIVYRRYRASRRPNFSGVLPSIASIYLTPFLGPVDANRFIDAKTRADDTGSKSLHDDSSPIPH